jgi:hypothetical protein
MQLIEGRGDVWISNFSDVLKWNSILATTLN